MFGGRLITVRGKHIRTKRISEIQFRMRSLKAYLADRWAHFLAERDRQAWRNLMKEVEREKALEARKGLSGQHLYTGGNIVRSLAGLGVQDMAPANLGISGIVDASFVAVAPLSTLIFFRPSPLAAGHRLYIWTRGPLHHSRIARKFDLRFLGVSPAGISSPYDVGPQIVARFGPLAAGDWLSLFVQIMRDDGGVKTPGIMLTFPLGQIG